VGCPVRLLDHHDVPKNGEASASPFPQYRTVPRFRRRWNTPRMANVSMRMAEVIIALGVIGSVVSCIEMGSKVADRLEYYLSRTKSPPQVFVTLYDTLPLLNTTFEEIRDACNAGTLDLEAQKRLTKTVEGCHRLVTTLEDYLQECLPVEGDSFAHTMKKAVKSIRSEKTIGEIQRNLETCV